MAAIIRMSEVRKTYATGTLEVEALRKDVQALRERTKSLEAQVKGQAGGARSSPDQAGGVTAPGSRQGAARPVPISRAMPRIDIA